MIDRIISDIKFKNKLILITILPVLGFLVFSTLSFYRNITDYFTMNTMEKVSVLAISASAAVHEIQKERGMTAGYIGSNGESFSDELAEQTPLTDEKILKLKNDFSQTEINNNEFSGLKNAILKDFDAISALRKDVQKLNITAKEAIGFYSEINENLLSIIIILAGMGNNAEISSSLIAYYNFIHAKEMAGIERAVLSSTFLQDQFSGGMYNRLLDLMSQQDVYIENFLHMADEQSKALYTSAASGKEFSEVERMEKIAINNGDKGNFGIDANYWFKTITKKINAYYEIDLTLSRNIGSRVGDLKNESFLSLVINLFFMTGILLFSFFSFKLTSSNLINRISKNLSAIQKVENGDLTFRIEDSGKDEIGSISISMNKLVDKQHEIIRHLVNSGTKLKSASDDLTQSSLNLSSGLEQSSVQSQAIASAAVEMNQNLQLISSSIEEMSISGAEMARNASEAANYSNQANQKTESTHELFQELNVNAKEISSVIDSITMIAKQTNLLALNASIEAASAGSAGKGFAVVASEVKELAMQSSTASDTVRKRITEIQKNIEKAVEAISEINVTIEASNQATTTIASAVEEQSIASKEISGNISQTTQASNEVTKNINGISQASTEGSREAASTSKNAEDLQKIANEIHDIVKQFKV
ncbi:MAG: methyl-accepting chemotaxis protein [Spirochaetia bacterium]|nr:methyl-accepting chemotaxis protein [Spirochaetia bacterium]